jgi:16S rRNA (cytidine1402-2'-O)-methyltransferase
MKNTSGKLYLIPTFIGDPHAGKSFPPVNTELIATLHHFYVENPKPARQFLKKIIPDIDWENIHLYHHDKHERDRESEQEFIRLLKEGNDAGLLSDAGCPGVADPGSAIVAAAHREGIEVIPLIGPSSLLLTLMGSGMNGQNFTFLGYLPKDREERSRELKRIATETAKHRTAFLFIETPYRTHHLLDDILKQLPDHLALCTGVELMTNRQQIISKTVGQWKKDKKPALEEKLVVFVIGMF